MSTLSDALRAGDVQPLCRPNAVFTAAVVSQMSTYGEPCEMYLELSSVITDPPALTVAGIEAFKTDLATLRVQIAGGGTFPLDIVREGHRWVVSFSDGVAPITAITQQR